MYCRLTVFSLKFLTLFMGKIPDYLSFVVLFLIVRPNIVMNLIQYSTFTQLFSYEYDFWLNII